MMMVGPFVWSPTAEVILPLCFAHAFDDVFVEFSVHGRDDQVLVMGDLVEQLRQLFLVFGAETLRGIIEHEEAERATFLCGNAQSQENRQRQGV